MKAKFFFVSVLFLFVVVMSSSLNAQVEDSIKLSSVSLSSGDGVLSQGLLFESTFTRGSDLIGLYLGERDLAISYLKAFANEKIYVGPVLEYYMNVPTLGVQLVTSPIKNISTFSWIGASAGTPGMKVELTKWNYLFYYQSVDYTFKRFSISGAIMEYGGWQQIIDFKYKQPIMKNFEMFSSVGYNFSGQGHSLLRLGISYKK